MSNTLHKKTNVHTERGAALLIFVIFFLLTSSILVFGIGNGVYQSLVEYRVLNESKRSFYAVEAGIEDAVYRQRDSQAYSSTESFVIDGITVNVSRALVVDMYEFTVTASSSGATRRGLLELVVGDGASFSFGLQSGNGGVLMSNNSNVYGNVFSNGTVEGQGSATVFGDIVVAGSTGVVTTIHATGSVWSHSLVSAVIDEDAYYYATGTRTATIVNGNSFPGSPDQATATMPIKDSLIEDWKTDIETTGTLIASTSAQCLSGTYTIETDTELNNVKIDCNVIMKKQGAGTTITISGPVWITGNLDFTQGPAVIASSTLGSKSVQIIVDNEINRTTSSKVSINQSTIFTSGNAQSYVVLISMNDDAENSGAETAINLAQSANGKVLVYAPHGRVTMGNSISLKEVTAYQIDINNGASIIYESGLMSLLFTGGPGGGFAIQEWKEIE